MKRKNFENPIHLKNIVKCEISNKKTTKALLGFE